MELDAKIKKFTANNEGDKLAEVISAAEKTPFTRELELTPFPPKCTLPSFPSRFDGTGDAIEHIKMYTMSLLQWKGNDVVMCKFFPASLDGEANNWFYALPAWTIGTYDALTKAFLENYMHKSKARPTINRLFSLVRRFREPLRSLTGRWRNLCTEIGKVPVDQQIFGFENALGKTDPIWISMFTEKPQTLKEMRRMQANCIALEEIQEESRDRGVLEASATIPTTEGEPSRRSEKRPGPLPRGIGNGGGMVRGKRPRREAKAYTPLNAPLEEIFKEVEKRNDIIYPSSRGIQFEGTKDHPGYCHYHQYRGHSTNDCREVKDIVQHLIRDGYLRKFVRHVPPVPTLQDAPVHQVRIDKSTRFVCNTISHSALQGYDLITWIASRIHKRDHNRREIFSVAKTLPMEPWMLQSISFSAKDVPMNGQAHGDPLVITILIEEWGVKRILVDSGSSVEVLFYDTFKRMDLSDDIPIPSTYRIYGFNGAITVPKGEAALKVSDGEGYLDTLTTFCVVDVASPYEAIIGRPWLAGINVVASAYHRRLIFPTYKGVVEIVGDPHAARQCMKIDIHQNEERRARIRKEKNKAKEAEAALELEQVISKEIMGYEALEGETL
ncbi:uncharacterized protein LOC113324973 [Papaver somniferum]|uniref:uncharacterized protein LOC113324973 n=1 Tax=Papaver somniferum TaxID=3469 RepID=UPI000E7024C1|nr:uncharacterized protein LOC113324973 [Papaver somniferum]